MRILISALGIMIMLGAGLCFSAEGEDILKEMEAGSMHPLTKIEGRASLVNIEGNVYLILTTGEGKNYLLKGNLAEEKIRPLKELEKKRLVIAGLPSNTVVEKTVINQNYDKQSKEVTREGYVVSYSDFLVLYIDKIEDAQEEAALVKKKYNKPLPPSVFALELRRIRGKVVAANFRNPIPTVEVQDLEKKRPNEIITISSGIPIVQVIDGKLMSLTKLSIKEGDKVEIWYEENVDQKSARTITILEKAH